MVAKNKQEKYKAGRAYLIKIDMEESDVPPSFHN